jgi:Cu2+-exporting ATPase
MQSRLSDVPAAIALGRATLKNIRQNLFWAFIYNTVGIPLAAGAFIYAFGLELNPMFGAAAMSLSSFCVVTNALRLNFFDMHDASKDKFRSHSGESPDLNDHKNEKEKKEMEKTMKIEGMMCPHCEATVKGALEGLEGVSEAKVSHEADEAVVVMTSEVADDVLKEAVEAKDYKVISIA